MTEALVANMRYERRTLEGVVLSIHWNSSISNAEMRSCISSRGEETIKAVDSMSCSVATWLPVWLLPRYTIAVAGVY